MNFTPPRTIGSLADSTIRMMTIEANRCGAINLGQGFPEFDPPQELIDAAKAAISVSRNNQYTEDRGLFELRQAIAGSYARRFDWPVDPEGDVTILCGVTEAIVASVMATAESGSGVAIIDPAHENYVAAALFAGALPIRIPLSAPEFALDLDAIEDAFRGGARTIIINSPHNPTGRVFTEAELGCIAQLCVKYGVIAITDEIYEHIIYDGRKHCPLALLPGMAERTITASGIGKSYGLTGWRIGYTIAPREITMAIRRAHTYLSICAPAPFQRAAITAFSLPQSYYAGLVAKYAESRKLMMEILAQSGFTARPPEGAYYVMADFSALSSEDDVAFSLRLVRERRVAAVPGSSFYGNPAMGRKLVRFAFPKPQAVLAEVARRIGGPAVG